MPGSKRSLAVLAAVLASILGGSGHLLKSWLGHRHYLAATLALSGGADIACNQSTSDSIADQAVQVCETAQSTDCCFLRLTAREQIQSR